MKNICASSSCVGAFMCCNRLYKNKKSPEANGHIVSER